MLSNDRSSLNIRVSITFSIGQCTDRHYKHMTKPLMLDGELCIAKCLCPEPKGDAICLQQVFAGINFYQKE